jgi:hypothetical protein
MVFRRRGLDANCLRLALDQFEDLRCRRELADIHPSEVAESTSARAAAAPSAVDRAGIATDALQLRLHHDLFRLESGEGEGERG